MILKDDPYFWLVIHKCIHPYEKKRCCIVVVWPGDISVHGDLGVNIGFSEDK